MVKALGLVMAGLSRRDALERLFDVCLLGGHFFSSFAFFKNFFSSWSIRRLLVLPTPPPVLARVSVRNGIPLLTEKAFRSGTWEKSMMCFVMQQCYNIKRQMAYNQVRHVAIVDRAPIGH